MRKIFVFFGLIASAVGVSHAGSLATQAHQPSSHHHFEMLHLVPAVVINLDMFEEAMVADLEWVPSVPSTEGLSDVVGVSDLDGGPATARVLDFSGSPPAFNPVDENRSTRGTVIIESITGKVHLITTARVD